MPTDQTRRCLWSGFVNSAEAYPERHALYVEKQYFSYADLFEASKRIAATLHRHDEARLAAVFGYRSAVAFSGVLGILLSGRGYVPLNRTFPVERTRVMFERSACRTLVVDQASALQLDAVIADSPAALTLLFPDQPDVSGYRTQSGGTFSLAARFRYRSISSF